MSLSKISEETHTQVFKYDQISLDKLNVSQDRTSEVEFPVSLVWRDLIYSVTYKQKQIKEKHIQNEQHDDREELEEIGRRGSYSSFSQSNPGYFEDIEHERNERTSPLIRPSKEKNIKHTLKAMNTGTGMFSTLFIDPNINRTDLTKTMPVLKQISGIAKPFEVVGVLGPSGCGKTSLLNVLSAREQPGKFGNLGGYVWLNGVELNKDHFGKVGAFVQQDDVLLSTMTPYECFKFGAKLKLNYMTDQEQENRVNKLIKDLRLTKCKNTKVGSVILRGLSGGERKRTSIGYELITNPALLLLDEPTSGIDSFTALEIMNLLHRQSRQGRTVVASIHQPSSDIFLSLDRVILMNRGHIIYQGAPSRILSYFKQVGFRCARFTNPADFVLKVALRPELANPISSKCLERDYLVTKYTERLHNNVIEQIARCSELNNPSFDFDMIQNSNAAPASTQLTQLIARHFKFVMRNPIIFKVKIFQAAFTLFFAASLWWKAAESHNLITPLQTYNLLGLSFFLSSNLMFPTALGIILNFPQLETLYVRQQLKKLYRPSSFYWSIILVQFVFFQVYPLIITFTYFFLDALPTFTAYLTLLAGGVTMTTLGLAMGYSMSIIFQGEDTARMLMVFLLLFMMLGSGVLVNLSSLRSWLTWLEYISVMRYNIEIYLRAFISSFGEPLQDAILAGFHYDLGYGACFVINLSITGFFLLLGWLVLVLRSK